MAKLIIIYWRDIPAQVVYQRGRKKTKQTLPDYFAKAIDRAAMRAGRGSSEDYLNDWRREYLDCSEEADLAVEVKVNELIDLFPKEVLEKLIKNDGLKVEQQND